ncbi:PDZ domain-containing protein [Sphingomonas lutea]|nr:PDZ domain-containing protein [Sphingomonas lutea]
MTKVIPVMAFSLALATAPALSTAQPSPKAGIGVAFQTQNKKIKVAEVMPGASGALMGIQAGDVITHAGGKPMSSQTRLTAYFSSLKVGDPVVLTVKRKGQSLELKGTAIARTW